VNEKEKEGTKKSQRNSKRPIDYDSDYEYPDSDENLKEQKFYIATDQKTLEIKQSNSKAAHLVTNNYNFQYNNYNHQNHQDNYQPDHEFHQRQMDVKRSRLPAHAVSVLKEWFYKHSHSPYPTEEEKEKFTKELSLTILQVNNWFTNARRRLLPDRV